MLHCWIFVMFSWPSYEIELVFWHKSCRNHCYYLHILSELGSGNRVGEQLQKGECSRKRPKECRGQNWQARILGESYIDGENVEKGWRETVWWEERVRVVKQSLMFISLLWVCTYWEEYQYVAAYWAVSDLSGYSLQCVRRVERFEASREVGERKWLSSVWSFRFLAVWTVVDSDVLLAPG